MLFQFVGRGPTALQIREQPDKPTARRTDRGRDMRTNVHPDGAREDEDASRSKHDSKGRGDLSSPSDQIHFHWLKCEEIEL